MEQTHVASECRSYSFRLRGTKADRLVSTGDEALGWTSEILEIVVLKQLKLHRKYKMKATEAAV